MRLIVGLGNPGPRYQANRHNVGFMVADRLCAEAGARLREKFQGEFCTLRIDDVEAAVLKPMTFMNLSGRAVQPAMRFYRLSLAELLVVHDELDLDFGVTRIKVGGGFAGHNGLKSIAERCGGGDFTRVRVGIGRPPRGPAERYVLSDFAAEQRAVLDDVIAGAADAVRVLVREGSEAAMNKFNVRPR